MAPACALTPNHAAHIGFQTVNSLTHHPHATAGDSHHSHIVVVEALHYPIAARITTGVLAPTTPATLVVDAHLLMLMLGLMLLRGDLQFLM